jgi:hypothetical protein
MQPFHAGRGIPNLGPQAIDLARANPDVKIILAHAGVSDLGLIAPRVTEVDNLYFDTAWWQMSDMLALCLFTSSLLVATRAMDFPFGRVGMGKGMSRRMGIRWACRKGAVDRGRPAGRRSRARSRSISGRRRTCRRWARG